MGNATGNYGEYPKYLWEIAQVPAWGYAHVNNVLILRLLESSCCAMIMGNLKTPHTGRHGNRREKAETRQYQPV